MARTADRNPPVLLREKCGAVSILTLNRPDKLNAISNELISAIMDALDSVEFDSSVRAIVITGAGRAFSAGADIAWFQPHMQAGPAEAVARFMRPGHQMTRRVEAFPKPIIAAVNGLAFGGGCELVEATHLALQRRAPRSRKPRSISGLCPPGEGRSDCRGTSAVRRRSS